MLIDEERRLFRIFCSYCICFSKATRFLKPYHVPDFMSENIDEKLSNTEKRGSLSIQNRSLYDGYQSPAIRSVTYLSTCNLFINYQFSIAVILIAGMATISESRGIVFFRHFNSYWVVKTSTNSRDWGD